MSLPGVSFEANEGASDHQIDGFFALHGSELVLFLWKSDWQSGFLLDACCVRLKIF